MLKPGYIQNLERKHLIAPYIHDFQDSTSFKSGDKIRVDAKKGWLLILGK